jgi:GH24 family phage-related lysozyme (muramidase)
MDEVEYYKNHPLTEEQAEALFEQDIDMILNTSLKPLLIENNIRLNQHQYDALVSFTFNLGQNYWKFDKEKEEYHYLAKAAGRGDFGERRR